MANDVLSLTPELLTSQAQEMANLRQQYQQLFQETSLILKEVNGSWSEYLANNFLGKIQSAQKGFNNVDLMLANGSAAAMLSVNNLAERDQNLARAMNGSGVYEAFTRSFGSSVQDFLRQRKVNYDDVMHGVAQVDDYLDGNLTDEQKSLINQYIKKLGLSDEKLAYDLIVKMSHGEYGEASQLLGKKGLDLYFETFYGEGGKLLSDYAFNWIDNTSSAVTQAYLNPTWENLAQVPWNMTVQPIAETAGNASWEFISEYFPGTADWYSEHGATNAGEAWNVALTEGYRLVLGDEAADYASTYYAEHGGVFQGVMNGLKDIGSYLKDQFDNCGWFSSLRK